MEEKRLSLEDLKEKNKDGSFVYSSLNAVPQNVTLNPGTYHVSKLEKVEADIEDVATKKKINRKWINITLLNSSGEGATFSASRLASGGFDTEPVKGALKGKWYYPTIQPDHCLQMSVADILYQIQGKNITIRTMEGNVPAFQLGSWDTKEEATKAGKLGFRKRQFITIDAVSEPDEE